MSQQQRPRRNGSLHMSVPNLNRLLFLGEMTESVFWSCIKAHKQARVLTKDVVMQLLRVVSTTVFAALPCYYYQCPLCVKDNLA